MHPSIHRPNPNSEYFTPERCHILELLNGEDFPYSLAQARVEPGVTTALHALKRVNEIYYVLSGQGEMEVGTDLKDIVQKGDSINIPAGMSQRITNTGSEDLLFLCFCAPRFVVECYEDLEEK